MSYYSRLATAIAEHEYCDRRETPPRRRLVQRMRDLELQVELLLGPFGQDYLSYPEEMIPSYSFDELKHVLPADLARLNEAEWALEHTKMQIILQEKQDRLSRISDLKRRRNNLTYRLKDCLSQSGQEYFWYPEETTQTLSDGEQNKLPEKLHSTDDVLRTLKQAEEQLANLIGRDYKRSEEILPGQMIMAARYVTI